jgi:hypothetical protein
MQRPNVLPHRLSHEDNIIICRRFSISRSTASNSPEAQDALCRLTLSLPFHTPPQLMYGEPWNWWFPKIWYNRHRHGTFEQALDNFPAPLPDVEQVYLRYRLPHYSGWSATPKPHHNASGFRYINNHYSHLGGLTPILDYMVWPEDAVYYPPEAPAGGPEYGYVFMACRILILSFVTRHFSNLPC